MAEDKNVFDLGAALDDAYRKGRDNGILAAQIKLLQIATEKTTTVAQARFLRSIVDRVKQEA